MAPGIPSLFDRSPRSDSTYRHRGEGWFAALNRRAGPEGDRIRALCEQWFERYPVAARDKLRGHFRSHDDRKFYAAFWELYLHESFLRLGYVVEVEPVLNHTPRRPDFRLTRGDERTYVEALTVNDDDAARGDLARALELERSLDSIVGFRFIGIPSMRRIGRRLPSGGTLRREVEAWLASMPDPGEGGTEARSFVLEDWTVRLLVMRRPDAYEGGFVLGRFEGLWRGSHSSAVVDRMRAKHGRYGVLDGRLTLAVMTNSSRFDEWIPQESLLGRERARHNADDCARTRGYWGLGSGNAVDTVIFASNELAPLTVPRVCPRVWTRSTATPSALDAGPWPVVRVSGRQVEQVTPGASLAAFFGLESSWPRMVDAQSA